MDRETGGRTDRPTEETGSAPMAVLQVSRGAPDQRRCLGQLGGSPVRRAQQEGTVRGAGAEVKPWPPLSTVDSILDEPAGIQQRL